MRLQRALGTATLTIGIGGEHTESSDKPAHVPFGPRTLEAARGAFVGALTGATLAALLGAGLVHPLHAQTTHAEVHGAPLVSVEQLQPPGWSAVEHEHGTIRVLRLGDDPSSGLSDGELREMVRQINRSLAPGMTPVSDINVVFRERNALVDALFLGRTLSINPSYAERLGPKHLRHVLMHEIAHEVVEENFLARLPGGRKRVLLNRASGLRALAYILRDAPEQAESKQALDAQAATLRAQAKAMPTEAAGSTRFINFEELLADVVAVAALDDWQAMAETVKKLGREGDAHLLDFDPAAAIDGPRGSSPHTFYAPVRGEIRRQVDAANRGDDWLGLVFDAAVEAATANTAKDAPRGRQAKTENFMTALRSHFE